MLTKHNSVTIVAGEVNYDGGIAPFKAEAAPSADYTDFSSLENWCIYHYYASYDEKAVRNLLITDYVGSWATLTDDEKKALIEHYVYLSTETTANLDLLYSKAQRDAFRDRCMVALATCDCRPEVATDDPDKWYDIQLLAGGVMNPVLIATDVVL